MRASRPQHKEDANLKHKNQHKKTRRGWEGQRGWKTVAGAAVLSAVGTLGATAQAISSSAESAGNASEQGPSATAPRAEQAPGGPVVAGQRRFDIAPGELTTALEAFGQSTGLHIHSNLANDKLAGFQSRGVKGVYTPADALRTLLSGTGLDSRFETPDKVEISIRSSEHVDVNISIQSIGLQQFPQPLLDTAQTVNTVPQFILQEQAATTLRDGLRNVPGISIAAGEGGAQGDNLTIRGFSARNDIYLDGIRDFGSYYRDAFDYEAIDVLQGPASAEFGRGSTGGIVNQETKVPGLREHVAGTLQLGTNLMRRLTADVNEPIEAIPGGTAFRLNVVGTQNNVAERNVANVSRYGLAPSLAFGLNGRTRGTITYLHESENSVPDYGLPYFGITPAAVDRRNFYGYSRESYLKTNPDVVTGKVEHDFAVGTTLRNSLRWGNYPRDVRITEPQINTTPVYNVTGTVVTASDGVRTLAPGGTYTATCSPTAATPCFNASTPLSQVLVRRAQIARRSTEDILWDQASFLGHLGLGRLENNYVVILEGGRERSSPQGVTYPTTIYTPALTPNPDDILPAASYLGAKTHVNSQTYGIGLVDTMKVTQWLLLSGGVRFDYFNTQSNTDALAAIPGVVGASAATAANRLDKVPTYRAAAVIKPRPEGSVYFDWGTSFNPSAESLSLSGNNATQLPQFNETYEAGAKWSFLRDRLNVNGAYFQTFKNNVYETDPANTLNVIPVGDQRVRGAQVGVLGHMPRHFDVIAGYAYLNGRIAGSLQNYGPFASVSAFVNGAAAASTVRLYNPNDAVRNHGPFFLSAVGNPFANVPKNSANLFVTHDLLFRFVGGFGLNQVSARRASSTAPTPFLNDNTPTPLTAVPIAFKVMPGYVTFNLMLRRPLSDRIDFQANIQNLTNKFYIDQPHPNHLIPGEGINAQFGILAHF